MLRTTRLSLLVSAGISAGISITAYATAQDQAKAVKISDSIYMAQLASNVYIVKTPAGNVVIDTGPEKSAPDAKRRWPGKSAVRSSTLF
jgi:hypothetical protein